MGWKKINSAVSMYEEPVFGTVSAEHRVMALSIDKNSNNPVKGLAREILRSNQNDPRIYGNTDESKLIIVESDNGLQWKKVADLKIKGIDKIISKLAGKDKVLMGLEDPDIWTDEKEIKHIYFTIALKYKNEHGLDIYLGHAQGKTLETLKATPPILGPTSQKIRGFKEAAISPIATKGKRLNLTESWKLKEDGHSLQTIAVVEAEDMGKPWNLKSFFDLKEKGYHWCKEELSPCRFIPKEMVDFGDCLVVIVNGREPKKKMDNKEVRGDYKPGLILFNTKTGEIPWIAKEPLFEDPDAKSITFASEFVQTSKDEGILYCHVDDSFVRAYKINMKELKKYIETNFT